MGADIISLRTKTRQPMGCPTTTVRLCTTALIHSQSTRPHDQPCLPKTLITNLPSESQILARDCPSTMQNSSTSCTNVTPNVARTVDVRIPVTSITNANANVQWQILARKNHAEIIKAKKFARILKPEECVEDTSGSKLGAPARAACARNFVEFSARTPQIPSTTTYHPSTLQPHPASS